MRSHRQRAQWMGILVLIALALVPAFLHGHDHGPHGAATSAPCAARSAALAGFLASVITECPESSNWPAT